MEHAITNRSFMQPDAASSSLLDSRRFLELAKLFIDVDWVAMNLDGAFQLTEKAGRGYRPALIPTEEAVIRLKFAKQAAESQRLSLQVFACTEARTAVALKTDMDPRDHKFLSGPKTPDGLYAFCGSLDAAISRALIYAHYADVVCFKSSNPDLSEAVVFASELKEAFPAKRLGFGYAPSSNGIAWNELDHHLLEHKLRNVGYDYYFVAQFGRTFFPFTPISGSWVLFNDASPAMDGVEEALTDGVSTRLRIPPVDRRLVSRRYLSRRLSHSREEIPGRK